MLVRIVICVLGLLRIGYGQFSFDDFTNELSRQFSTNFGGLDIDFGEIFDKLGSIGTAVDTVIDILRERGGILSVLDEIVSLDADEEVKKTSIKQCLTDLTNDGTLLASIFDVNINLDDFYEVLAIFITRLPITESFLDVCQGLDTIFDAIAATLACSGIVQDVNDFFGLSIPDYEEIIEALKTEASTTCDDTEISTTFGDLGTAIFCNSTASTGLPQTGDWYESMVCHLSITGLVNITTVDGLLTTTNGEIYARYKTIEQTVGVINDIIDVICDNARDIADPIFTDAIVAAICIPLQFFGKVVPFVVELTVEFADAHDGIVSTSKINAINDDRQTVLGNQRYITLQNEFNKNNIINAILSESMIIQETILNESMIIQNLINTQHATTRKLIKIESNIIQNTVEYYGLKTIKTVKDGFQDLKKFEINIYKQLFSQLNTIDRLIRTPEHKRPGFNKQNLHKPRLFDKPHFPDIYNNHGKPIKYESYHADVLNNVNQIDNNFSTKIKQNIILISVTGVISCIFTMFTILLCARIFGIKINKIKNNRIKYQSITEPEVK